MFFWSGYVTVLLAYFSCFRASTYNLYNLLFMNIFRIQIGSPIIFYAGLILYANHILCKPLINSTSNDPCYRQVYLCMKIALNIHLTWCAELYIRAIVELEWVNVSENLHDKTGWLHSEDFSSILSKNSTVSTKNIWRIFDRKIHTFTVKSASFAMQIFTHIYSFELNYCMNTVNVLVWFCPKTYEAFLIARSILFVGISRV